MMKNVFLLILALSAGATAAVAQEATPPGGPEGLERLNQIRMQRMRQALGLDEAQAQELGQAFEENRRAQMQARLDHQASMLRVRRELAGDPVDQNAVRSALDDVERNQQAIQQLHDEHQRRLATSLNPEQRAKLMLFNEQFESRLRELVHRRGGPGAGRPGGPGGQRDGVRGGDRRQRPGPGGQGADAATERIAELENRIAELERQAGE